MMHPINEIRCLFRNVLIPDCKQLHKKERSSENAEGENQFPEVLTKVRSELRTDGRQERPEYRRDVKTRNKEICAEQCAAPVGSEGRYEIKGKKSEHNAKHNYEDCSRSPCPMPSLQSGEKKPDSSRPENKEAAEHPDEEYRIIQPGALMKLAAVPRRPIRTADPERDQDYERWDEKPEPGPRKTLRRPCPATVGSNNDRRPRDETGRERGKVQKIYEQRAPRPARIFARTQQHAPDKKAGNEQERPAEQPE